MLANNFLKYFKSFQGSIDFNINSKKKLMDWQKNKGKPSNIDVVIKEVVQDSSGISIRSDCLSKIKTIKTENVNNIIIGNLDINFLSSKFDDLKVLMADMCDILVITETKLDNAYPVSQFHIDGFSIPYRLDENRTGGGVIVYVGEDIPSKLLSKLSFKEDIEGLFVDINFRKRTWLLGGISHPPSQPDQYFFDSLDRALDVYCNYEKVVLVGDSSAKKVKRVLATSYFSKNCEV